MKNTRLTIVTAVFLCVLSSSRSAEAETWTIPGVANLSGANNTHFVSDLALTNPGTVPVIATLTFLPPDLPAIDVSLGAGQTVVYRNILAQLWGVSRGGAVQVTADSELILRARTYNDASAGTFGAALPVFADDQMLSLGDTADSLWISQSDAYRTNVAVVFPDEDGGSAVVTIYDADGIQRGTRDYEQDTPGFIQLPVSSFASAVPVARAEIVVTRGRANGYSVVVDNVTGDNSIFSFEDLPAGYQDVLVNGVARTSGANGTFFRTDGRFYNPASEDATVTVAFHAGGASNATPLVRTFVVPAGKIRDVVDVLSTLLSLPVGSGGALRFSSEKPVAILCRTSNLDPSGVKPGAFGAQQKPTQLLSFLTSADAGALVTGIRQNATFRTNIGFAAGPDGANFTLTLRNTSGATVATTTGSQGVFGWMQPNIAALFQGTTVPEDATLFVRVTSGSVDIYDASVDNASGDSVVTPIMPVPVNLPSSATIGPAGGSIRSSDGVLTLKIPAGALSSPVAILLEQAPNDAPGAVGPAGYDLSPDGLAFAKPALLSLTYGPGGLDVPGADGLSLVFPSGNSWAGMTGGRINTAARTLTVSLPNTTPSLNSSQPAGRIAKAGASRYGIIQGLEIFTLRRWVLTDGTADLLIVFRVPPTASGEGARDYLISDLNLDPANVVFFTPAIGTITRDGVHRGIYHAPHSIARGSVPVKIRVKANVTRGAGIPAGRYDVTSTFHVVRRRWAMRVEFKLNIPCEAGSGNEDFSYAYADDQFQNFRLSDEVTGLVLKADPFLGSLPAEAEVKNCKCTAKLVGLPGTVTFNFSSGSLKFPLRSGGPRAHFEMNGEAQILNMVPAVEYICPNPVPPPATQTFVSDPSEPYTFDLLTGLAAQGGFRPIDKKARFIVIVPPILTIIVDWQSIPE